MTRDIKLRRNYSGATVTVKGKLVMEKGKLLNTPSARGWWKRQHRIAPVKKSTF